MLFREKGRKDQKSLYNIWKRHTIEDELKQYINIRCLSEIINFTSASLVANQIQNLFGFNIILSLSFINKS